MSRNTIPSAWGCWYLYIIGIYTSYNIRYNVNITFDCDIFVQHCNHCYEHFVCKMNCHHQKRRELAIAFWPGSCLCTVNYYDTLHNSAFLLPDLNNGNVHRRTLQRFNPWPQLLWTSILVNSLYTGVPLSTWIALKTLTCHIIDASHLYTAKRM